MPPRRGAPASAPLRVLAVAALAIACLAASATSAWSATIWTPTKTALPAGTSADSGVALIGSSCWAPGACVAVGHAKDADGNFNPLVSTLSAGSWTSEFLPLPGDGILNDQRETRLGSVDCGPSGDCVAVGGYQYAGGLEVGLIATRSGGAWTSMRAPEPADAGSYQFTVLNSVACNDAVDHCVAVGTYYDVYGFSEAFIATLADGSWTSERAPMPADAPAPATDPFPSAELQTVACSTDLTTCYAVGHYTATDCYACRHGLIVTLDGGTWSAARAPEPADVAGSCTYTCSSLYAGYVEQAPMLACSADATTCVAVGQYADDAGGYQGMVATLSGGSWTASRAPAPVTTAYGALSSVSCSDDGSLCAAVGHYDDADEVRHALVATRAGGTWTGREAPAPPGAETTYGGSARLRTVSCAATGTSCVAAGGYEDDTTDCFGSSCATGLLARFDAGTLSAVRAPLPSDAAPAGSPHFTGFTLAECRSAPCFTAGQYADDAGGVSGVFDTLTTTPDDTTITVANALSPSTDAGRFDLKVGTTVVKAAAGDGESGTATVKPGTFTVSETGASTALADYVVSVACTKNGQPLVSASAAKVKVTVAQGDAVTCTFKNVRKARVTLRKVAVPSTDPGRFNLKAGSTVVAAAVGDGGSGTANVAPGSRVISEVASSTATDVHDYTTSITCTLNGNDLGSVNARQRTVTLAPADVLDCTFTNVRKARVTLHKTLVPSTDPGLFRLRVGTKVLASSVGDGGSGTNQFAPGTYTVNEIAATTSTKVTNYATTIACTLNGDDLGSTGGRTRSVTLGPADVLDCTFTNTRL